MYKLYRELLDEFIAFCSISTDPARKLDMLETAEWLKQQFETRGFKVSFLKGANTNPVVLARYDAGRNKTTLVYGHYDVQPAEMDQGWTGDPFTVREQEGRLLGRGLVDDKGQVLIHMVSVFEHIKNNTLGTNVLFMIEGNEETANPDLPELLTQFKDSLACDTVLVSDGEMVGNIPTIDISLRGGFNLRLKLKTAPRDMHSGLVGGAVANAAQELVALSSKLHDANGKVLVPGFYDNVPEPPARVLRQHAKLIKTNPPEEALGISALHSANDTDFYTQTGLYPTIQISGLGGGYTAEGFANIVPATAELRLNVRTVAGQDTAKLATELGDYLQAQAPWYTKVEIMVEGIHDPVQLQTDNLTFERAQALLQKAYGYPPIMKYVGGAIPIVLDFKQVLGRAPLLVGLGNDDCRMHGPDENFRIDLIKKGLMFSQEFFAVSGAEPGDPLE